MDVRAGRSIITVLRGQRGQSRAACFCGAGAIEDIGLWTEAIGYRSRRYRMFIAHVCDRRFDYRDHTTCFDKALNFLLERRIKATQRYDLAPEFKNGELRILVLDKARGRVSGKVWADDHPLVWAFVNGDLPLGIFVDYLMDLGLVN
jgi:hypothetical protein